MKNEIIIYHPDNLTERIEVRMDEEKETIWLNQKQLGTLFQKDSDTIGLHLKNIYLDQELNEKLTTEYFSVVQQEGNRIITRKIKFYNLDAIISVGYRVNSKRGTQFRQWATQRLKDYLLKGYSINNRINRLEDHLVGLTKKVDQIDLQINTKLIPTQGVYMDGQVFDAYALTSRIIRSAKQIIVLIDNFIDEQTFTQLSKKQPDVLHPPLTESETRQSRQTLSSLEGGSVSLLEEGLREVITNNTTTSKLYPFPRATTDF